MTYVKFLIGDCLETLDTLDDESVNCCITSPPYFGLRDYGHDKQIGLEKTPDEYVKTLVKVFSKVKRVLKNDGTLWLNLGDTYSNGKYPNHKEKDLIGIPWMVAFALKNDGWYLRQDIIWHKGSCMPESVKDRFTRCHEYLFLFSKSKKYYFDQDSVKEKCVSKDSSIRNRNNTKLNNTPGRSKMKGLIHNNYEYRNRRSVWSINPKPFKGAHFATFPPDLIEPCILSGCPVGGVVLDVFSGSGTTGIVSKLNDRNSILCELNPEYVNISKERIPTTLEFD